MSDREGRPFWDDGGVGIWASGFPTYWVMQYGGSGLWYLSYGAPHYRGWAVYKGNLYRDVTALTVDCFMEDVEVESWREFDERRQMMNAAVKAALLKAKATANPEQAADKDFEKTCPILHGFLVEREGEKKGEFRETASLLIFTEDGAFKACLNDRESGATLWKTAPSFQGLLNALEVALGSPDPGWRVRKAAGAKGGPRKGKGG